MLKNLIVNLKELSKNAWFMGVVKTVVERVPFLKQLFAVIDGKKAAIGRIMMFVGALLTFLQSPYGVPELFVTFPWLETLGAEYVAISGYILTELGLQHDVVKKIDAEKEGVVKDI